jgi:hypothetical protein
MRRSRLSWIVSWIALAMCIALATPALADPGDKAGWSLLTDPRRRAFLLWVPEANGPRVLMLACLRDAGIFTTMSSAVDARDEIDRVKLTLTNGPSRFEVDGSITHYPHIGRSSFISDLDVDDHQFQAFGRKLLPVLGAPGDLTLTITPGTRSGAPKIMSIPSAGLASVLGRFRDVCFR